MTEREPFARTVEDEGNVWVCVGQQIVNQFAQGEGLIVANNLVSAVNAAFNKRLDEEIEKAREEDRKRICELACEKSEWETKAKQRFALRAEIEKALGFDDGETYDEDKFKVAVKRIKALAKARKEWERGE